MAEGQWSISTNEENYFLQFDTIEAAISEGKCYGRKFWVGKCVRPIPPEELFDRWVVENWLDNTVMEHDDYSGEWAEHCIDSTVEQREELAAGIRSVISAWFDKHKLRPCICARDWR